MTWFAPPPRFAPPKPKKPPFAPPNPFTGKPTADTMLAPPGWFDDDWDAEERPQPAPPSYSDILEDGDPVQVGKKSRTLEWNIAIVSLIVYIGAAVWMRAGLGYAIGDALARSANARAMVQSRYPGIAPVGFVWMPLPTLIQVPFVIVLAPFGLVSYAGPVANSFCGALAAYILVRTCRDWGLYGQADHNPRALLCPQPCRYLPSGQRNERGRLLPVSRHLAKRLPLVDPQGEQEGHAHYGARTRDWRPSSATRWSSSLPSSHSVSRCNDETDPERTSFAVFDRHSSWRCQACTRFSSGWVQAGSSSVTPSFGRRF